MLFLFFIIGILSIIVILFIFSTLRLEIKNLKICSSCPKLVEDGYLITIGLYVKEIQFTKFILNNQKIKQIDLKEQMKKIHFKENVKIIDINRDWIKVLKNLDISLEKVNLNIRLDTFDVILTSYLTAILSSIIGIIFGFFIKDYDENNQRFVVRPEYINKNFINLNLSCIFSLKIRNIIKEIIIGRRLYFNKIKSAKF